MGSLGLHHLLNHSLVYLIWNGIIAVQLSVLDQILLCNSNGLRLCLGLGLCILDCQTVDLTHQGLVIVRLLVLTALHNESTRVAKC